MNKETKGKPRPKTLLVQPKPKQHTIRLPMGSPDTCTMKFFAVVVTFVVGALCGAGSARAADTNPKLFVVDK